MISAVDVALCQLHRLLQEIPAAELDALLRRCTARELLADEILLEPGEENHTLFFLLQGRLAVRLHRGGELDRFVIEPGEIVGEMSIIERRPVMARVTAELPSTVLAMPEEVFWSDFCTRAPFVRGLLLGLVQRMRKADGVLRDEFERHVRYEMLQKELESAARIQANILPAAHALPATGTVDVCPLFKPARAVGGDFYDVVPLASGLVAVSVGDVSGKGMPAALFMVRVITLMRQVLYRENNPAAILPELNRQLCAANDEFMFVTLALLILDPATGRMIYLNGGHLPVLIAGASRPFETWKPPSGPLLGVNPDGVYELSTRTLQPGETVLLYTDGVTEAENERKEMLGLTRTIAELSQATSRATAADLIGALERTVTQFTAGAPPSDDITAIALTLRSATEPAPRDLHRRSAMTDPAADSLPLRAAIS